jgi:glucan 1,3-beta-glucosidase
MTLLASRRSRPVGPLYRGSCLSILRYYLVLCLSSLALASRWTVNNGPNDKIRGVNLGGHLVLECWLTPSICAVPFESKLTTNVSQVRDEWTLCSLLGKVQCQALLEEHWRTYYSESDFVQIKAYGLNTVRIPIGYWALTPLHYDEPYVAGQIPYLQQLLKVRYHSCRATG